MSSFSYGDTVRMIDVSQARSLPRLSSMSHFSRVKHELPGRELRVIDVETFDNAAGESITRVTVEWTGLDSSGHFSEFRHAMTTPENLEAVAS